MQTAPSIPSRYALDFPLDLPAGRPATRPCHGGLPRWQVRRVTDYIDANLGSTLRTASLAATLGLSVSHFTRAFKHSVGVPPRVFVIRRRLAAACEAMVSSNMPLTTIAHAYGFCDQSHFTRTFHEVMGLSPHVWRCLNARDTSNGPFVSEQRRAIELAIVEAA